MRHPGPPLGHQASIESRVTALEQKISQQPTAPATNQMGSSPDLTTIEARLTALENQAGSPQPAAPATEQTGSDVGELTCTKLTVVNSQGQPIFVVSDNGFGGRLEVHQPHNGINLWYHVGILDANGLSIDWGESHRYDQGRSPKCALDGTTIVEVHQGHNDTDLWYRVGTVDIPSRTIAWQPSHQYDRGNIPSVAINGNTVIETHQSHEGENLWFKVGKLQRVTGTISWGPSNNYGNGKIPNIEF